MVFLHVVWGVFNWTVTTGDREADSSFVPHFAKQVSGEKRPGRKGLGFLKLPHGAYSK